MPFRYDIDNIFAELEEKVIRNKRKDDESKENNPIESPEDAPETQEVAPATSKTSEETHGGDEAAKEIKDSPNSVQDGENLDKKNKTEKTTGVGEKEKNLEQNDEQKNEKDSKDKKEEDHSIELNNKNKSEITNEDLFDQIRDWFYEKKIDQELFMYNEKEEYLKIYMLEIIKKIAAEHAGIDKQDGSDSYDKKQMINHMMKKQSYKILGDKYDLRDARYVQFFIDTSGVYGCGSNRILNEFIPKIIDILERQGYECHIAACGNGFYSKDMIEDEIYGTRKTLEMYKTGKVSEIACPTPETAAKMANEAEFSIILADFDGLSSICRMAKLCQKDKVPYFFCTEDRYPWEDPTLHDWVNPEECKYDPNLVYDVSMNGNPTLKQFQNSEYDGYGYEYDD